MSLRGGKFEGSTAKASSLEERALCTVHFIYKCTRKEKRKKALQIPRERERSCTLICFSQLIDVSRLLSYGNDFFISLIAVLKVESFVVAAKHPYKFSMFSWPQLLVAWST